MRRLLTHAAVVVLAWQTSAHAGAFHDANTTYGNQDTGWESTKKTQSPDDGENRVFYYARRVDAPPDVPAGSTNNAAIYISVDPAADSDFVTGLFINISDQNNANASGLSMSNNGTKDGIYVAQFGAGIGYEAAGFANGSRGFISTLQWESPDTEAFNFANSTLYAGVWGNDGTGGATVAPSYGMIYMQNSLGKTIRTKLAAPGATGFSWGASEYLISSNDLTRNYWDMTNNGQTTWSSREADASNTVYNDTMIRQCNSWWTGSASQDKCMRSELTATSGAATWTVKLGTKASEATAFSVTAGGNPTFAGTTLRITQQRTIATYDAAGNVGDIAFDNSYLYYRGSTRWYRVAWEGGTW